MKKLKADPDKFAFRACRACVEQDCVACLGKCSDGFPCECAVFSHAFWINEDDVERTLNPLGIQKAKA